jgi:hypothetical protein
MKNSHQEYFDKHKHLKWDEWLIFQSMFKCGVQGVVGIFKSKTDDMTFVFKVSQKINHLIKHEYTVMESLNCIADFCPHFIKGYGMIECDVNPHTRRGNVFDVSDCKRTISKDVLIMEHLTDSVKLKTLLKDKSYASEKSLFCIIKQVLLSVLIAQKIVKFTHYDLYYNNVMVKNCDKNLVMLYIIDEDTQYVIPTNGYLPTLIDFGFSYAEEMNGGYMWANMNNTNCGFYSDRFSETTDFRHFLITMSDDLDREFQSDNTDKLLNITRNLFRYNGVDWETGWLKERGISAGKEVEMTIHDLITEIRAIKTVVLNPTIFDEYSSHCIHIIQTLIHIPMKARSSEFIGLSFVDFIEEFNKIESNINSPYYLIHILKEIVDLARNIRNIFYDTPNRPKALSIIRKRVFEIIDPIAKFCMIDKVDFERMFKGLYKFSECMEGMFFTNMKNTMAVFNSGIEKMPIPDPIEMFDIVHCNIPIEYTFSPKTSVMVIDCINRMNTVIPKLTEECIKTLNTIHESKVYNNHEEVLIEVYGELIGGLD